MKTKGIVTFALGNPIYGKFAFNLALSCKQVCPSVPIVLYYTDSAIAELDDKRMSLFDKMIPMPVKYMRMKGSKDNDYFLPKLHLNKLAPFDVNIFLDADSLLFKDPFNQEIAYNEFQTQAYYAYDYQTKQTNNIGYDYTFWCEPERIKTMFKNKEPKRFYSLSSTFIYFEKGELVDSLLETALSYRGRCNHPHKSFVPGGTCDELFLALALAESNHEMIEPYVPIYFNFAEKKIKNCNTESFIYNKHIGLTNGGNVQPLITETLYNNLVKALSQKNGFKPFLSQNKRAVLAERRFM